MSHQQSRFLIAFGMTFFLLSFFLPLFVLPAYADPIESKSVLQIPLVGKPITMETIQSGFGIAYYIENLYKFLVGISGILAVLAIVYGGFMWMASAGNTGKIGEAQKIISNAIAGLALALGSFVLLQTINPKLVEFGRITPTGIDGKKIGGGTIPASAGETIPSLPIRISRTAHTGNYCCGYIKSTKTQKTMLAIIVKDKHVLVAANTSAIKSDCTSIASLSGEDGARAFGVEPNVAVSTNEYETNVLSRILFCPNPIPCPSIDASTGKIGSGSDYDDQSVDQCISTVTPPPVPSGPGVYPAP